jgi:transcription termination/antitermination protein NusA
MLVALGEKGVKTLDDLGDLASDELIEIVGADNMDEAAANDVIMAARAHWFVDPGSVSGAGEAPQEAHHD